MRTKHLLDGCTVMLSMYQCCA